MKKLATLLAITTVSAFALAGVNDERANPPVCDRATGSTSQKTCFKAALSSPEVNAILNDRSLVPAMSDGRLNANDIKRQLKGADRVGTPIEPGMTEDADHDESRLTVIDPRTLASLRESSPDLLKVQVNQSQGPINVTPIEPPPPGGFPIPPFGWTPAPDNPNYLDVNGFLNDIHQAISPNVNGYALKIRRDGVTIGTLQWNWARNPGENPLPWKSNSRMHVASISKFMSAIGLVHMLDAQGIDTDSPIIDYLPSYWNPGSNVQHITFEDLMNHVSGFGTGGSSSSWATMKSQVEAGVAFSDIGNVGDYENMNFGLIRILMATIGGYIHVDTNFGLPWMNDQLWDVITSNAYNQYMQANIFNPVGATPTLTKNIFSTRAYRFNSSGSGWNSGDLSGVAGGVGWHMTINEILDVTRALRNGNLLGSSIRAQQLLNESWGLNSPLLGESTDTGRLYYKAGRWTTSSNALVARTEQAFVMMMPDDMELVVFVNSEISGSGVNLTNLVRTTYLSNIVIPNP